MVHGEKSRDDERKGNIQITMCLLQDVIFPLRIVFASYVISLTSYHFIKKVRNNIKTKNLKLNEI